MPTRYSYLSINRRVMMNKLSYLLGYMEKRAARGQHLMEALRGIEKGFPEADMSIKKPLADMIPGIETTNTLGYMEAKDLRNVLEGLIKERGPVTAALSPELKHAYPNMTKALADLAIESRAVNKGIKERAADNLAMDKTIANLFG